MTKTFYPILNILPYFTPMNQLKKRSKEWIPCHHAFSLHIINTVNQKCLPSIITVTCDSEAQEHTEWKDF